MTFVDKFNYKIKEIAGDYYYEKMPIEETIKKCFVVPTKDDNILRCQEDIDRYISDNMNIKMPLDGP